MSEFWVRRVGLALHGDTADSADEIARLSLTGPIFVEAKSKRNGAQHALYWVLCTRIGKAVGQPREVIDHILKISVGHCITVKSKSLGWNRIPKSISFAQMKQESFDKFFEAVVAAIYTEFGIRRPEVLAAVADLLAPKTEMW